MVLSYGGMTLYSYIREQRERLRLRTTFSRYVSANYFVWTIVGRQLLSYRRTGTVGDRYGSPGGEETITQKSLPNRPLRPLISNG